MIFGGKQEKMHFPDDEVLELLDKLPSESACVDYKRELYRKTDTHNYIKDIIAMLNSEEAAGSPKIILMGVTNKSHYKCGVNIDEWKDDNEWQDLLKKINPRPKVVNGFVNYDNKYFAYVYIYEENYEWVYEAADTVIGDPSAEIKERNGVFKGQAFTRHGSQNGVLDQKGREKLVKKRILNEQRYIEPPKPEVIRIDSFVIAALLGSWNESYSGDIDAIQQLSGKYFEEFTGNIRNISQQQSDLLSYKNKMWYCANNRTNILSVAPQIYDDTLENFFSVAEKVFLDTDPKYELPTEQRHMASILLKDKKKKYSYELLKGIANTIAILGNEKDAFPNVSKNKIKHCIIELEKKIFGINNWRVFATVADTFQQLGEASPGTFLDEINRLITTDDPDFSYYMNEKEDYIFSTEYGYQLGSALSIIAQHKDYFSLAFRTIMMLASRWERFIDNAVGIVLPWFPQTNAEGDVRVGVIKGINCDDEIVWKLLMKLMPGVTIVGSPVQRPDYLAIEPISEKIPSDYMEVSAGYIDIACSILNKNIQRIIKIVSVIDDVDEEIRKKIIESIKQESAYIDQTEKEKLWNALQDFIYRHKKFSDAKWALSQEALEPIKELAAYLFPDSREVKDRRLFRYDQYKLYDYCDESDPDNILFEHQKEIVKERYRKGSVKSLIDFSNEVGAKGLVGSIAANYLSNEEIKLLIEESDEPNENELLKGIVLNLPFEKINMILEKCNDSKKASIVALLGLSDDTTSYIENLNDEAQNIYWKHVNPMPVEIENKENARILIYSLNSVGRSNVSLYCLYLMIMDQRIVPNPDWVINTLQAYVQLSESKSADVYAIHTLIKWLQRQAEDGMIKEEDIIGVEWQYLNILDQEDDCAPVFLWRKMSNDGRFYSEVLKGAFGFSDQFQGNTLDDSIRTHLLKLLRKWKRPPGLEDDRFINQDSLNNWISEVNANCIDDQRSLAMEFFGEAAFNTPPDRDGFFIDRAVVQALIEDATGEALRGYAIEEFNSQGVKIVDPTGEDEFKIEAAYRKKAEQADAAGYLKFADTLRLIADNHHQEGERNKLAATDGF